MCTRKNFKSNLVHVVILLLESQRSLMSYVVRETSFQMFLSVIGEIGERPQSPSIKMPCQLFEWTKKSTVKFSFRFWKGNYEHPPPTQKPIFSFLLQKFPSVDLGFQWLYQHISLGQAEIVQGEYLLKRRIDEGRKIRVFQQISMSLCIWFMFDISRFKMIFTCASQQKSSTDQ